MVVIDKLESTSLLVICTVFTNFLFWWNLFIQFPKILDGIWQHKRKFDIFAGHCVLCLVHDSEEEQKHASSSTRLLLKCFTAQ